MIKSIVGSRGVIVTSGLPGTTYVNMNNPSAGLMRYNGNTNNTEIYDGTSWLPMQSSHASIELDAETLSLMNWARKKRSEEYELERLAKTNPTIKDLVEQVRSKQDQIKMVQNLIKKEDEWADVGVQAGP